MEMEINPVAWSPAGFADASGRGESAPDWHGLRSRLEAAHAARRALLPVAERRQDAPASFDGTSARLVATYGHALCDVNPKALGDGKPVGRKGGEVADGQVFGGRG